MRLRSSSLPSSLARIPVEYEWGPTKWPVHWCDLLGDGDVAADCGVHAALARSLIQAAGLPVKDAKIAIRDFGYSIPHWRRTWQEADVTATWIGSTSVYHETLLLDGRYWDPSEARWFDGVGSALACGTVVATRVDGEDAWTYRRP